MSTITSATYQSTLVEKLRAREFLKPVRREDCCNDLAYRRRLVERHLNAYLRFEDRDGGVYRPLANSPYWRLFEYIVVDCCNRSPESLYTKLKEKCKFSPLEISDVITTITPLQRTIIINTIAESKQEIHKKTIGERVRDSRDSKDLPRDERVSNFIDLVTVHDQELTPSESAYADCFVNC